VLVSADRAKSAHWQQALAEVNQHIPVTQMVFDEAHLPFTADKYRDSLTNLYDLRLFPMQLVVMSGTVQPASESTLIDMFGLDPDCIIIRTPTIRPELEYILEHPYQSNNHIAARVVEILNAPHNLNEQDRALIFVPYLDQGKQLAEILHCDFYNGDKTLASNEDKEAMYTHWIKGTQKVMVCTAAFGAGNDYPHVRTVVHAGSPWEMIGCI